MIKASKSFVRPYLSRILAVLMPRLQDSHTGVATSVLCTLGELSEVGGTELIPYCRKIFSLVIKVIQEQGSIAKRTTAVRTLAISAEHGFSCEAIYAAPRALDFIISELEMGQGASSPPELRTEIMNPLGLLGPLIHTDTTRPSKILQTPKKTLNWIHQEHLVRVSMTKDGRKE